MSSKIIKKFFILGAYQILGGLLGLAFAITLLVNQTSPSRLILLIILIGAGLYFFSVYCGILLLRKKLSGLFYSKINQYLQLFSFSSYGYAFQYVSGFYFTIGIDLTDSFLLIFDLGLSSFQININTDSIFLFVRLNVIALFAILFIEGLKNTIEKEKLQTQIAEIGK